ncbi:hypothetical protein TNIN_488031 [Trichonephila inaurata madagascariensis]|uniref:Peptidase A2 domain-containing protein n=1 Tax=Trichonephila inaurata madagascariensis TaxID=2747483 RepID=A0A8X6XRV7_9ARAC|nr:hypothetical protein TNIN_488031 [Trichonephila inaurata madagascariensis]
MAFLGKVEKQDLILLAEDLGLRVSDKMTIRDLKNIIIGSKDYEEEFVKAYLFVIPFIRVKKEEEEGVARHYEFKQQREQREFELEKLRLESELDKLRLETGSIRSNVTRESCAEDPQKTSSNYRISIVRADEHVRETSAVLMAKVMIPVLTRIKEEKEIDDLRAVHVKGEQEIVNAAIDTGAQVSVVRANVVEGQSVDNGGTTQVTSAIEEHEIRLIENSQLVRNPAILRVSSKKEEITNSTDSKSVGNQEVTGLRPETYTQTLLDVPNENLVAVEINASNVQTNGQSLKESGENVALFVDSFDSEINFILPGNVECWKSNVITFLNDSDEHVCNQFQTFGIAAILPNIVITLKQWGNVTDFVIIRKTLSFVDGARV